MNMHDASRRRSSSGMVLLLVLGVLGLMSVLAVSFVSMARLERSISRNYVDQVRAQLAAESGVEKAFAALEHLAGAPTLEQLDGFVYGDAASGEGGDTPLSRVSMPSYAVDLDGDGDIDSASGDIGGTYIAHGDRYKLKVEDESAKFNLNDAPGVVPAPARMFKIIENLCNVIFDSWDTGTGTLIAANVLSYRDHLGGRFHSMDEVRDAVLAPPAATGLIAVSLLPAEEALLDRVLANCTLYSWIDPNTLKPNPPANPGGFSIEFLKNFYEFDENRFDYDITSDTSINAWLTRFGDDVYTVGQFQTPSLSLEPRAPVHLNFASAELIEALLVGIQGVFIYDYGHQFLRGGSNGEPNPSHSFHSFYSLYGRGNHNTAVETSSIESVIAMVFSSGSYNLVETTNHRPLQYSSAQFNAETYKHPSNPFAYERATYNALEMAAGGLGSYKKTIPVSQQLAADLAAALHDRIHDPSGYDLNGDGDTQDPYEGRNAFRTWQEFQHFIRAYFKYDDPEVRVPREAGDVSVAPFLPNYARQSVADAILANFNPNADICDWNPNKELHKLVDKAHLLNHASDASKIGYTTEFSLEPTGVFGIRSLGMILGQQAQVITTRELEVMAELYRPYRLTTQKQFLGGDSSRPLTTAADLGSLFAVNNSANPTAGAEDPEGQFGGMFSGEASNYAGFTVQCYPEPLTLHGNGTLNVNALMEWSPLPSLHFEGAVFDGYLMPATYQDMADTAGRTFQASFNSDLTATYSKMTADNPASKGRINYTETPADVAGLQTPLKPESCRASRLMIPKSLQDANASSGNPALKPGNLYVDGGYSEAHKTLLYRCGAWEENGVWGPVQEFNGQPILSHPSGNFGADWGERGRFSFWVKPNWMPERTGRPHVFFDATTENRWPVGYYVHLVECGWDNKHWVAKTDSVGNDPDTCFMAINGPFMEAPSYGTFRLMMHPSRNTINDPVNHGGPLYWPLEYPHNTMVLQFWTASGLNGGWYKNENGAGVMHNQFTMHSNTTSHRNMSDEVIAGDPMRQYHVDGHRWSHLSLTWDAEQSLGVTMMINGGAVDTYGLVNFHESGIDTPGLDHTANLWRNFDPQLQSNPEDQTITWQGQFGLNLYEGANYFNNFRRPDLDAGTPYHDAYENLMRFGAWARGSVNYSADATFDEIRVFSDGFTDASSDNAWMLSEYEVGRYYKSNDEPAVYVTPKIDPRAVMALPSFEGVSLRSVSWTLWWPDDVVDTAPGRDLVSGNESDPIFEHGSSLWLTRQSGSYDDVRDWDLMTFDVETAEGEWLCSDEVEEFFPAGKPGRGTPLSRAGGSVVRRSNGDKVQVDAGESVRLKAYFNVYDDGAPLHQAPILDDITCMFSFMRPRILSWRWAPTGAVPAGDPAPGDDAGDDIIPSDDVIIIKPPKGGGVID